MWHQNPARIQHLQACFMSSSRWADLRTSPRSLQSQLNQVQANFDDALTVEDRGVLPVEMSLSFPRIKTTSLSTKRIVIEDEVREKPVTLVLMAFRSFAQKQVDSWRIPFENDIGVKDGQVFDLTINETWAAQAFSGFTQLMLRHRTPPEKHDYTLAFNSKAREPLEDLLPDDNRLFGYALLLDRKARVRYRCAGMATERSSKKFLAAAREIIEADGK